MALVMKRKTKHRYALLIHLKDPVEYSALQDFGLVISLGRVIFISISTEVCMLQSQS